MKFKSIVLKILLAVVCLPFYCCSQKLSPSDTANVHFLNARKFYIYKVEKGETLYSISQKFSIPQEEILQFNHAISKEGLKAKMKLWIPAYSWLKKDSLEKKEVKEAVEIKVDNSAVLQIGIVTTLNLPKLYLLKDTSTSAIDEPLKEDARFNLEFIEGITHAAEILKAEGLKFHLYYIDAENDSNKLYLKLRKREKLDLIITNETGGMLRMISNFSRNKNIRIISCALNTSEFIKDNNFAFSLIPSSGKQCEMMGKFSKVYFTNSVLTTLKTSNPKENDRSDFFRNGWESDGKVAASRINDCSKGLIAGIGDSLVKGKNNIIFISSSNEDFVSSILNSLKTKTPDYQFTVIGLPTWQYFETIDQYTIQTCNVHVFNSGFIDYNWEEVSKFRKYFRDKYFCEPSENAFLGYDALFVAGKNYLKNGKEMINKENQQEINGIYSQYLFDQITAGVGYENRNIHVFQPGKDITTDLMKKVNLK